MYTCSFPPKIFDICHSFIHICFYHKQNITVYLYGLFQCFETFNSPPSSQTYPLCAIQLKDRMDGAKDSETCIRRNDNQANLNPNKYCDPLGDYNVFGFVKVNNNTVRNDERFTIIAATRVSVL